MLNHRSLGVVVLLAAVATSFPTLHPRQGSASNTSIITAGARGESGLRHEIHDLQKDADAWNIYLLGLQRFKNMSATDPLSYYQVAGIHGQPYVPWNDVGPCSNCTLAGYCTHQSTLFPTWHRTYLALFEQSLVANALAVANEFKGDDKARYLAKANSLRMPYWDWAQPPAEGEEPFPQMFSTPTVTLNTPSGMQNVTNPLLKYSFKDGEDSSFLGPNIRETTRKPAFTASNRQQLRSDLWTLLSSQQDYNAFSTEALLPGADNFNPSSLEGLHDNIHVWTGGQMGIVPQAAFDPVFWLHHAMVDHIFALYQDARPKKWLEQWAEVGATMAYASGTLEDSQSSLKPFHKSADGTYWNSDAVRDTETFKYQYADLANGQGAASVINSLYRDNEPEMSLRKRAMDLGVRGMNVSGYINDVMNPKPGSTCHEYVANIQVDSMKMEGSFTVFIFSGPFDEDDPSGWYNEKSLIGSHGFFSGPESMGDGSALVNAGATITDSLLLNKAGGLLDNLTHGAVTGFLKKYIEWRIVKSDGTILDEDDVPGLEVAIMTAQVQVPGYSYQLPSWGAFKPLKDITSGRKHGFGWKGDVEVGGDLSFGVSIG